MKPDNKVKVGQIWQDWDTRYRNDDPPRLLKVIDIWNTIFGNTFAMCRNLKTGRFTNILISRMKPNARGYKLVKDIKKLQQQKRRGGKRR